MEDIATSIIIVCLAAFVVVIIGVAIDIERRGCSHQTGWTQAFFLYFLKVVHSRMVARQHVQTEHDTSNFPKRQEELLLSIIRDHENTAYGKDHDFSNIESARDFRHTLPVAGYDHVQSYVDRVADGETSALLPDDDPVKMFAVTSGTTGRTNKHYPVPQSEVEVTKKHWIYGSHRLALWRDVGEWNLRRSMFVVFRKPEKRTRSGVRCGKIASFLAETIGLIDNVSTPPAGYRIENELDSHYIHALFGLRDAQLDSIQVFLLPTLLTLVKRMHAFQADLINDISCGRIKDSSNIPDKTREKLNSYLTPMPERALEVRQAFAGGIPGLIPRLWPKLRYVIGNHAGLTGDAYYQEAVVCCGDSIPILASVYACSEAGLAGLILDFREPQRPVYTLMPDAAFYEFVPVLDDQVLSLDEIRPQDVIRKDSLMIGCDYELIITTRSGLCRFRLGDVFRLVGYYNEAPQLEFLYRAGQLLNILSEKVTEKAFQEALEEACAGWPRAAKLKEYTVTNSLLLPKEAQKGNIPHHVLFVELEGPHLSEAYTNLVDECLARRHEQYRECREMNRLGAFRVYQLRPNTFEKYREHVASNNPQTATKTFKVPRALKRAERVQWFLERKADKQPPRDTKKREICEEEETEDKPRKFWFRPCCPEIEDRDKVLF